VCRVGSNGPTVELSPVTPGPFTDSSVLSVASPCCTMAWPHVASLPDSMQMEQHSPAGVTGRWQCIVGQATSSHAARPPLHRHVTQGSGDQTAWWNMVRPRNTHWPCLPGSTDTPPSGQDRSRRVNTGQDRSIQVNTGQYKSRQVKTGQYGSIQVKTGQDGSIQVKTGQDGSIQVKTGQYRSIQVKTGQYGSIQVNRGQDGSIQVKTGQYRSRQVKTGQYRSRQVNTGQYGSIRVNIGSHRQ